MERIHLRRIIIVAFVLALLLFLNGIFSAPAPKVPIGKPPNAPPKVNSSFRNVPTPQPSPKVKEDFRLYRDTPLGKALGDILPTLLPYRTENFVIEYFPKEETLAVSILSGDLAETQGLVYEWLRKEGVKDPENLGIFWSKLSFPRN